MKRFRKQMAFLLAAALVVAAAPCPGVQAAAVKLNKSKLSLTVGKTAKLKLKNTKKKVTWKSSKKSVATVSKTGLVRAKKKGTATITAKAGKKKYKCKVTCRKDSAVTAAKKAPSGIVKVSDISFASANITLEVGQTSMLSYTVRPGNATDKGGIKWQSYDTGVATVNENGVVTAVSEGVAPIKIEKNDEYGNGYDYCNVTVVKQSSGQSSSSSPSPAPVLPPVATFDPAQIWTSSPVPTKAAVSGMPSVSTTPKPSAVPTLTPDTSVTKAPLVDQANTGIPENELIKNYRVSAVKGAESGNVKMVNVTITGSDLAEHTNSANVKGHWVGMAVPKGNGYLQGRRTAPAISSLGGRKYTAKPGGEIGNSTVTFYFDVQRNGDDTGYVIVRHGSGVDDSYVVYNVNFTNISWKNGTPLPSGTASAAPSGKPTAAPSATPSGKPTAAPSTAPSGKPTAAPSVTPSGKPTAAPTVAPSQNPTAAPTNVPKNQQDVDALRKLIAEQRGRGASVDENIDGDEYTWENGRLTGIHWNNRLLCGNLDVTGLSALTVLDCSENQTGLESLDVSKNSLLTELYCYDCSGVRSLDVSDHPALTHLLCYGGGNGCLLDINNTPALTKLWCGSCSLWFRFKQGLAGGTTHSMDAGDHPALEDLDCSHADLTGLDISRCPALKKLNCADDFLSDLDISHNPALTYLDCSGNKPSDVSMCGIKKLDISANPDLEWLDCRQNEIPSLYISGNPDLEWLDCSDNQLQSLDVSNNMALKYLSCAGNYLKDLDVSNHPALEKLVAAAVLQKGILGGEETINKYGRSLNSLDVSGDVALEYLSCDVCGDEKHTGELNISNTPALKKVVCRVHTTVSGQRKADFSDHKALKYLSCTYRSGRRLLDVSNDTALEELICVDCGISSLDLSNTPALKKLECDNNYLTSLDVSHNAALLRLGCSSNQLTDLDLSRNPALEWLECGGNQLQNLDVSNNPALERMDCRSNQLAGLDVSHNAALKYLYCGSGFCSDPASTTKLGSDVPSGLNNHFFKSHGGNQLKSLDVSHNPLLKEFTCGDNQLTSLDISRVPTLELLDCRNNQLTDLDVSRNPNLGYLHCSDNQLTSLDVSHNPALYILWCQNNQLTSLDVSHNPELDSPNCDRNVTIIR